MCVLCVVFKTLKILKFSRSTSFVDSNRGQVQQCESCLVARSKGEHHQSASPPLQRKMKEASVGSGGTSSGASGSNEERKSLSWREANLWTKLVELRDLPAQDSLAAFPPGLGNIFCAFTFGVFVVVAAVVENDEQHFHWRFCFFSRLLVPVRTLYV